MTTIKVETRVRATLREEWTYESDLSWPEVVSAAKRHAGFDPTDVMSRDEEGEALFDWLHLNARFVYLDEEVIGDEDDREIVEVWA